MRLGFWLQDTGVDSGLLLLRVLRTEEDSLWLEAQASAGFLAAASPLPSAAGALLLQSLEWLPVRQAPGTGGGRDRTLDLSRLPVFLGGAAS